MLRQLKTNAKITDRVKQAKVASIQPNKTAAESKTKPQPKSGKMWAALEAMHSELAAIKETVSTRPTTPPPPPEFAKTKGGHSFQPKHAAVPRCQGCQDCQVKILVTPASIVLSVGILPTLLGAVEIGDNSLRKTGVGYF